MSKYSEYNPKGKENRKKEKEKGSESKYTPRGKGAPKTAGLPKRERTNKGEPLPKFDQKIRLNKYLSNAGICSRREADTLIASGVVAVNGKVITELGYKVEPTDKVQYDGATINHATKRYVLLNKPKDFGIGYDDAMGRKSALQLIKKACKEQVFPVGKMHRNTSGLMLYTNDSDMDKKLAHPKFKVAQIFQVSLDKPMEEEDLEKLKKGIYVDERMFSVEDASFIKGKSHHEIGVSILSSNSNIVALMMGKLGYEIVKMDRVSYAGLTKKDLPRGNYRQLTENEVAFLKMS